MKNNVFDSKRLQKSVIFEIFGCFWGIFGIFWHLGTPQNDPKTPPFFENRSKRVFLRYLLTFFTTLSTNNSEQPCETLWNCKKMPSGRWKGPCTEIMEKWSMKNLCFPTPFPVQNLHLLELCEICRVKISCFFFLDFPWIEFLCTSSALPCVYEFALVPHLFSRWNNLDFYGVRVVGSVQSLPETQILRGIKKIFTHSLWFVAIFWASFLPVF